MERLTFVTPVFEAELLLLELQARSFARHLEPGHPVVVLDNTARGLSAQARRRLLAAYGPHAGSVRLLRPDEVCALPTASGWRSQQVLKLAVAALVDTAAYVTLDAKNHLVAAPEPGTFVGPDGRPRVRAYGYRTHPLRPALEHVLTYLGLPVEDALDRFAATVTPFTLEVATVLAVTADVAARAGRPFAQEFVERELTEYFLYAGWLLRRDGTLERALELTDDANPVVWPRAATLEGVREVVETARSSGAPVFGVHRNAVPRLDEAARAELAAFWAERGLVDDEAAGERLLRELAADHTRQRRRQQLRDLRPRVLTLGRRARARVLRHDG
ncbi:DUF6492 family protein [Cellulomonas composti]|uniref:Uncharacterized protein n=1 Tax=Cellulomonas composti TaxID=266130 RepID=A0A511JAH5_9CELL|nr:DUF6492 family protein [Cellulomonas composti]GEL94978.1 hypothetical protein CCO02nite_16360 [Cellulomonas composti]